MSEAGLIFPQLNPYKKTTVQTVITLLHFKSLILKSLTAAEQVHCLHCDSTGVNKHLRLCIPESLCSY